MIETIFYFPSSQSEYDSAKNNLEISRRTISFVPPTVLGEPGAIYKDGIKYGGLTTQEFHQHMTEYENYEDSWIKDELDKIKGDIIDHGDIISTLRGLIDGINSNLDELLLDIESTVLDKIEQLFLNSLWIQAKFPMGEIWGDSNFGIQGSVKEYMQTLGFWTFDRVILFHKLTSFTGTPDRISTITQFSQNVPLDTWIPEESVGDYINDISLIDYIIETESGSTKILRNTSNGNVEYYEIRISFDGQSTTKWSRINQEVNNISASVNSVIENGDLTGTGLSSTIQALIDDSVGTAVININTTYADYNKMKEIVEWMYAGLRLQSGQNKSITEIYAAGGNDLKSALANVKTWVTKLDNGDFASDVQVAAKVKTALASLALESTSDNVIAAMSASLGENTDNIASIMATVDSHTSTLSAITQNGTNTSGFITRSNLDESVAELFAAQGNPNNYDAKASVVAYVKNNKSSLDLNADDININGYLNGGQASFKGDIRANSFVTGADNESGIAVMSGQFVSSGANTNKLYIAYDGNQQGVTLWFYTNGEWKSLDLNGSAYTVQQGAQVRFTPETFYQFADTTITTLPDNAPITTLYYCVNNGMYYDSDNNGNLVTGTYYKISNINDNNIVSNFNDLKSSHSLIVTEKDIALNFVTIPNTGGMHKMSNKPVNTHSIYNLNVYHDWYGALSELYRFGEITQIILSNGVVTDNSSTAFIGYAIQSLTGNSSSLTAGQVKPIFFKRQDSPQDVAEPWIVSLSGDYWDISTKNDGYVASTYVQGSLSDCLSTGNYYTTVTPGAPYDYFNIDTSDSAHKGKLNLTYTTIPQHSSYSYVPPVNTNIYE